VGAETKRDQERKGGRNPTRRGKTPFGSVDETSLPGGFLYKETVEEYLRSWQRRKQKGEANSGRREGKHKTNRTELFHLKTKTPESGWDEGGILRCKRGECQVAKNRMRGTAGNERNCSGTKTRVYGWGPMSRDYVAYS